MSVTYEAKRSYNENRLRHAADAKVEPSVYAWNCKINVVAMRRVQSQKSLCIHKAESVRYSNTKSISKSSMNCQKIDGQERSACFSFFADLLSSRTNDLPVHS